MRDLWRGVALRVRRCVVLHGRLMPAPTLAMLSAILHDEPPRRPVCSSYRRNKHGWVVASCSFPAGHENDHRDVHSGDTWV